MKLHGFYNLEVKDFILCSKHKSPNILSSFLSFSQVPAMPPPESFVLTLRALVLSKGTAQCLVSPHCHTLGKTSKCIEPRGGVSIKDLDRKYSPAFLFQGCSILKTLFWLLLPKTVMCHFIQRGSKCVKPPSKTDTQVSYISFWQGLFNVPSESRCMKSGVYILARFRLWAAYTAALILEWNVGISTL